MNPPGRILQHLAVVALIVGAGIYTFYERPASRPEPVNAPAGEKAAVVPADASNADALAKFDAQLMRGDPRAAAEGLALNGSSAALEKLITLAGGIRSDDLKKRQLAVVALEAMKACFTIEVVDFLAKDLQQEERFSHDITEAATAIGHPKLAEALARRSAGPVDFDTERRLQALRKMGAYGELLAVAVLELYPLPKERLNAPPRPALAPSTPLLVEKVARSAAYGNKLHELAEPKRSRGWNPLTPQQFAALLATEQEVYLKPYYGLNSKPILGRGCSHLMGYPPHFKSPTVKAFFLLSLKRFGNRDALPWLQAELAAARQSAYGYPKAEDFEEAIAACDPDPGLLAQPDIKKRWAAIKNFSDRGDDRALPAILNELKGYRPTKNVDPFLADVINALSHIRNRGAIDALTRLANSNINDQQLELVAEALGNLGDPACVPGLIAILPNARASSAALSALGQIDTAESSKALYDYFLSRQRKDRTYTQVPRCVEQLKRHRNGAALGYLLELARNAHPSDYSEVARNLRERDPATTLPAIAKVISSMPPRPRQMLEIVRQSIEADQQARALGRLPTMAKAGA